MRALAVLAVFGFHLGGGSLLAGGFIGVDVFFVLSGFLITALLVYEAANTRRIDLLAFWGRRAVRLYPALVICLLFVAALTPSIGVAAGAFRRDMLLDALGRRSRLASAIVFHQRHP